MAVEWMLPAAFELYERRQSLMSTWDKIVTKLLGPKTRIAIVGPGGVGKSVLLDQLTGNAHAAGYTLPAQSRKAEMGLLYLAYLDFTAKLGCI